MQAERYTAQVLTYFPQPCSHQDANRVISLICKQLEVPSRSNLTRIFQLIKKDRLQPIPPGIHPSAPIRDGGSASLFPVKARLVFPTQSECQQMRPCGRAESRALAIFFQPLCRTTLAAPLLLPNLFSLDRPEGCPTRAPCSLFIDQCAGLVASHRTALQGSYSCAYYSIFSLQVFVRLA